MLAKWTLVVCPKSHTGGLERLGRSCVLAVTAGRERVRETGHAVEPVIWPDSDFAPAVETPTRRGFFLTGGTRWLRRSGASSGPPSMKVT
jgi:hypothetical protein